MTEEERKEKNRLKVAKWRAQNSDKEKAARSAYYEANREKHKAASEAWQKANPEKLKAAKAAWRKANSEKIKAASAVYYAANTEKCKTTQAVWRKANLEKLKATSAAYYAANPEKVEVANLNWQKKNLEKLRIYRAAYQKNRRAADPVYAVSVRLRNRLSLAFKTNGYKKQSTTEQMLGCSFSKFKRHIESQFVNGMNWNNRSEWHLDHIVPLSCAITIEGLEKLSHYSNIRPIWAADNLAKSDNLVLTNL